MFDNSKKIDNRIFQTYKIFQVPVNIATYETAYQSLREFIKRGKCYTVSAANTQILTEARRGKCFLIKMKKFDLILPDGMPLVWLLNFRLRQCKLDTLKDRVYGPAFMEYVMKNSSHEYSHFLFGGSKICLQELINNLTKLNPNINIAGRYSPPFRLWDESDQNVFTNKIKEANPDIIWVALGGIKQEEWIIENKHRFNKGVFIAIGDAFELLAGRRKWVPKWVEKVGMTWFYRLTQGANKNV